MRLFDIPVDLGDSSNGARLECYLLSMSEKIRWTARPAVVICPGGAYRFTNDREAEPVAMEFLSKGYHAFVLRYSVAPSPWPIALKELAAAVKLIRSKAAEWSIDSRKLVVAGFSAGGHLAAEFACKWDRPWLAEAVHAKREELEPQALILGYPVISSGEYAHETSIKNLLQEKDGPAARQEVSLQHQVSACLPPVFLWHTASDEMVPVQNSLQFAWALSKHGIPYELHIFPYGVHGLALANRCTLETEKHRNDYSGKWIDEADAFLEHYLFPGEK